MKFDAPIRLDSARAWRTYHGGKVLDEMHAISPAEDTHFPEDWIISTVRAINQGREDVVEGLNKISGTDETLADWVAAAPEAMLGAGHVAKWGAKTAVLLKVIDAAERLGVQCHPDKERAMEFFHSPFGKTECWHILGGRTLDGEPPHVYMGFKPGITEAKWREVFDQQDIPAMLGMLHRIEVQPGDTFFIEGGMPHAIGKGCLLMEIQEPTDYTFRTEKVTPQGFEISDKSCHYGIGFDNMFKCFHYEGYDEPTTRKLRMVAPKVLEREAAFMRTSIIGYDTTPCFALERLDIAQQWDSTPDRFCGLYVFSGRGTLRSVDGETELRPGVQFFVPATSAAYSLHAAKGETITVFKATSA